MIRGSVPNQMMPRITPQPGKLWKKTMHLLWPLSESLVYYEIILAPQFIIACLRNLKTFWCLEPREEGSGEEQVGWQVERQKTLKWSSIHLKTMGQYGIDDNNASLLLLWINRFIYGWKQVHLFVLIKWCRIRNKTYLLFFDFMKVFRSNILHLQVWINLARWICHNPLWGPGKPLLFSTMDS